LVIGGLFLLAKSTHEIHTSFEIEEVSKTTVVASGFISILVQIAACDVVFSLDLVITAVGLVDHLKHNGDCNRRIGWRYACGSKANR
jgi:predicted tellurium resistance membrane protein TerC